MKDKNDPLSHLLTAAGAIMFYTLALPMLDSMSSWVQSKFNAKSIKLQHDLKQYEGEDNLEETKTNAMGFYMPDQDEEEEDCD